MAIRWCVVVVLALVLIQAKARDVPTEKEAISEAEVAHNSNTNTVTVGTTDKNTVPGGKSVKDKKCGFFSGIGGWGAMGGFIPLRANAVNADAEAVHEGGGIDGSHDAKIIP